MLTVRLSEQDARHALRRIDERVLNGPGRELRPRAERPGLEPVVVLGVAALPGYPVRAVADLVDAVEEGEAPGDLPLGDIVPGALHLGLDEDVDRPGPLLENRRLEDEEAELLAVDVLLRLEDVALLDLDRVPLRVHPGHGDEPPGLLRLLALLGVVRRLEVKPRARGVSNEGIVQKVPKELLELPLNAEDDHEQRVEDAARVEVRDDEALLLELGDEFVPPLLNFWKGEDGVKCCFVDHAAFTSTLTALMMTVRARAVSSSINWKLQ